MKYQLNCTQSTGAAITAMQEEATEITYRTFVRNVGAENAQALARGLGYERDPRNGLTLKNDYHVSYRKSKYEGIPCYYLCYSRTEYIFF